MFFDNLIKERIMVDAKSFNQKAFEKIAMIRQNKDFKIMLAKNGDRLNTIFCLQCEGGDIIPLCNILSKQEIDNLEPLFKETEEYQLNQNFDKFLQSLDGWENFTISDWNNLDQNPNCLTPLK
tara:strand:+ start:738 stop:1106 length:369 start_codon:yes stop_codon:yes gene_type:complete